MITMGNDEVTITVGAKDESERTFASVRRNARKMLTGIGKDANAEGGAAGASWAKGLLGMLTATLKPGAVAVATGLSAQLTGALAAGLASGAVHVAQGFGAALALLPALALAGGVALGTLKLALTGVGDALKAGLAGDTEKFNEALKGLSPNAQAAARELVGARDQLDSLKHTVQDNFFGPLIGQLRPVTEIYLRQLHLVLGDVATGFGLAGRQALEMLKTPAVFRGIFSALSDAGLAVTNLTEGLGHLLLAFVPLLTVGASFLPGLTDGFGTATERLAAFMQEAERTGALRDFIQRGIDALKQLWSTGAQVVRILRNVADIGRAAFAGMGVPAGGLLDTIERLTEQAQAFFATAEGQGAMATALTLAKAFATAFLGTLQKVGEILAPIIPQIVEVMTAFANLKTAVLEALAPAVQFIGEKVLPALTSLMEWLANNGPVLQGILIGLFTAWAIQAGIAAAATLAATWPFILVGVAVAALAALIITHWDTIKAVTLAVWNFVLGIIQGVWNWVKDNWPLLLLILTGPIGAAVLLIIAHWNTIKGAVLAVFNWVKDNWPLLLGILTGPIGWAVLLITTHWNTIKDAFTGVKDWIGDRVDDIVEFIMGIPGRIAGIGGQIADKITSGLGDVASSLNPLNLLAHGGVVGAAGGGPRSGLTMVGEHGRELVNLAPGSRVHSNAMTEGMLRSGGGGGTVRLVIDSAGARIDDFLVELLRLTIRDRSGGDVQAALGG